MLAVCLLTSKRPLFPEMKGSWHQDRRLACPCSQDPEHLATVDSDCCCLSMSYSECRA